MIEMAAQNTVLMDVECAILGRPVGPDDIQSFLARHRIATLYDVLRFFAQDFVAAFDHLHEVKAIFTVRDRNWLTDARIALARFRDECNRIGLQRHKTGLFHIAHLVESNGSEDELTAAVDAMRLAVIGELTDIVCLVVDDKHSGCLFPTEPLLGKAVDDAFPGAARDINEAGKCLALERYDAVAVYLCAVIQTGISALAKHLGQRVNYDSDDWNAIIQKHYCPAINRIESTG